VKGAAAGLTRRAALTLAGAGVAYAGLKPFAWAQGKSGLHGLSIFGDLKYGRDFKHFDYVNADAPKAGTMRFQPSSRLFNQNTPTFNTLNGFVLKGDAPPRIEMIFDTLMARANDEPDAVYGLLAESVAVSDDGNVYTFTLRPEARFHDGTKLTAEDVAFSLTVLKEKGHPNITQVIRELVKAEALDETRVALTLSGRQSRDLIFTLVSLPVFSKAYYATRDFAASTLEPPLGSAAYKVASIDTGRSINFTRVDDYWGNELPVNVGQNNFDLIRIDFYRDRQAAFEALKKGDTTYREEFTARVWATQYDFPAIKAGKVKQVLIPDKARPDIQAWYPNGRREKFADPRTRQAMALCFDFEWTNKNIFYSAYERGQSYFEKSDFVAEGPPSPEELALLEPFRAELPATVFGVAELQPTSDGSGRDRKLLRRAAELLKEAGWIDAGGVLKSAAGERFTCEFLVDDDAFNALLTRYVANLKAVGIDASIRVVDSTQYNARQNEFDFDVIMQRVILEATPLDGMNLFYGSDTADIPGTYNLAGIKDKALDALIAKVPAVQSRAELTALLRAMDRILRARHYAILTWTSATRRVAHWDMFGRPETSPPYAFTPETTWWYERDKAIAIGMAG
jgi:microcin C transport system substrate-binding protein